MKKYSVRIVSNLYSQGKFVVGNNLTETVMFVDIETATAIYSTPSSVSVLLFDLARYFFFNVLI